MDDDEHHLNTFRMILEEAGYFVDSCTGSAAALFGIQVSSRPSAFATNTTEAIGIISGHI